MNTNNQSRRAAASPEPALAVRTGAGVLGLARADAAARSPAPQPAPQEEPSSQGTLIVGEGIHVKGQIQSCTTLVVEGRVEASLEAAELTVHAGGLYDGKAVVESAFIGGDFTGDLTVRGLLTVAAGGCVGGTLRYGELRIEQGGRLSGDIDLLSEGGSGEETPLKVDPRDAAKAVSRAQAQGQAQTESQAASERLREGAGAR
jgi:cytoskeletal protein CcmA (bactofilin family)